MNSLDYTTFESNDSVLNVLDPFNQTVVDYAATSADINGPLFLANPEELLDPVTRNPAFIPIILTHVATFIFGVVGNIAVIYTWGKKHQPQTSLTASFLVSLAVADLILLCVFLPLETLGYFVITWDEGGSICKVTTYIEMLSGTASVLNLVAVSIERFLVIVYPMKARSLCTMSKSMKGIIFVWILALLLSVPTLYTKNVQPLTLYNNSTVLTVYYCLDKEDGLALVVAYYQLLVLFVLPALFMTVCYFIVIKVLWSSTKTMERLTAHIGTGRKGIPGQRNTTVSSPSCTSFVTNGYVLNPDAKL